MKRGLTPQIGRGLAGSRMLCQRVSVGNLNVEKVIPALDLVFPLIKPSDEAPLTWRGPHKMCPSVDPSPAI